MKFISTIVVVAAIFSASPAFADMFCVQKQLTDLGYEPGPVDGAFGGKTAAAASSYAADFGMTLPTLDKTNSQPWCDALVATAATPEGKARRFDVTSQPEGVLSAAATQQLWDLYKNIDECLIFDPVAGSEGVPFPLPTVKREALAATSWQSPFTPSVIGAPACKISAPNFGFAPAPVPVVKLDEAYGERVQSIDNAMAWFQRASTYVRMTGDPVARQALKSALLDWARDDSMGKGIRVSWGRQPIDYQMYAAVLGLLAATAEVAPDLTAEDKAVIGPWLNGLVKVGADSRWRDRPDNKTMMTAYVSLLWGIIIDDSSVVREGIESYKRALHFMRPDGSFPIDSQRGGMGIQYNSYNATYLLQLASAVERAYGIDLFSYSADGRSIHDAVDFVVRSIRTPGETNAIYAIACPESGDRWGTIQQPSMYFAETDSATLLLYAERFPESENAAWIKANLTPKQDTVPLSEHSGGAAICQFAASTAAVFTGPSIEVAGIVVLPKPEFRVTTHEEVANETGISSNINSLFTSRIEGAKDGEDVLRYNITGKASAVTKEFYRLEFVVNDVLAEDSVKPIWACGTGFDIKRYEDEKPRIVIKTAIEGNQFVFPDLDCVAPYLTPKALFSARFLASSFKDIAIGMVGDGTSGVLGSNLMREWIEQVATGEVTVTAAAPR